MLTVHLPSEQCNVQNILHVTFLIFWVSEGLSARRDIIYEEQLHLIDSRGQMYEAFKDWPPQVTAS